MNEDTLAARAMQALRQERRWVIGVTVAGMLAGLVWALVWPPDFAATARFRPQGSEQNASQLAGLAAQFGVAVAGMGGGGESPDYYAELIRSDAILRPAVLTTYPGAGGRQLLQELDAGGRDERSQVARAVDALRDRVWASVGPKSGLVLVRVELPDAELSEQVARRLLVVLDEFNRETRQSQASQERLFVEQRVAEAERELREAETTHLRFLEQNRRYESAPETVFEEARLSRRVSQQQQVYSSLAQAFEQARIDEVRNTPVITVIDPPEGSARRNRGGPLFGIALGLLLGLAGAVAFLLYRVRRDPPAAAVAPPAGTPTARVVAGAAR